MILIASLGFIFNISGGQNICISEDLESESVYAGFYGANQRQTRPQIELEITGPGWYGQQPGIIYKNQSFNITVKYGGEYNFCFKAKNETSHTINRSVWFQNEHSVRYIKVQNHENRTTDIVKENAQLIKEVKRQKEFYEDLKKLEYNTFYKMLLYSVISLIFTFIIINAVFERQRRNIKKRL